MRAISCILSLCFTLVLGGVLCAEDAKPAAKSVIQGVVSAIDFDAATITVKAADGKESKVTLTNDTKLSIDGIEAGMANVQVGDTAVVKAAGGTAETIVVKRAK